MKKIILLTVLGISFFFADAQEMKQENVPVNAVKTFYKLYPNSSVKKWEKEDGNYEAHFKFNNAETSVSFDQAGAVLETETEIRITELPKAASDYIAKNYRGQVVKEASKIVNAKGVTTYEAELKSCDLIFDSTGKFLKKEAEKNAKD